MFSALSVSMPITSFAASEKKETSQKEKILEVTNKNNKPVIYDKDGVKITVQNTIYDANSGNGFYQIEFMVENNSNTKVLLSMKDSSVDDFSVSTYTGRSSIEANKRGIIDSSIWEKDYKSYDVEDFQNWNSNVTIMLDDEEVLNEDIKISKEVFKSKDDADSEEKTTDTNSSEVDSETTDNTSDIEARLSALEDNTKELEEKNKKLEKEKKELEEKVKKLEEEKTKQEKEEKKKEKKSKETPTEAPSKETPASETTTPEPAAEAETPATHPVVEYKDATTIKIVQAALNEAGYNCGTPDGSAGAKTTEAITKYQTDKGLTINGLVTDEVLQSLNIVEKVQNAVQEENTPLRGKEGVKTVFSRLAEYDGVQVSDPIEEQEALGYVVWFNNNRYSCIVNPNNNGKISISISPQENSKSTVSSEDYFEIVGDLIQSFDTTLSSYEAYTVVVNTINQKNYSLNGYDYTFNEGLLAIIMTH